MMFKNDYFFIFDKAFDEARKSILDNTNSISKRRWFESQEIDGKQTLLYDVSGINESDIKLSFNNEGYKGAITVEGKTETDFGVFDCGIRFTMNAHSVGKNSSYYIKNGILYIEVIPDDKNKFEIKKKEK